MEKSLPRCTLDFYQSFAEDQMAFAYLGPISDDITELIIETNIEYIPQNKPITLKRRFSFLLAESFQNLIRHSDQESRQGLSDIFFLSTQHNNQYFINSINKIKKTDEDELTQRLTSINSVEPENLRKLYLSLLDKNEFNSHGGAGLGLIEMVRKSGQKLQFGFESISENKSLFVLQLLLNGSNTLAVPQSKDAVMRTYYQMKEKMIVFALKGRFIDTCMPVSLQAILKIMQILNIKEETTRLLHDKAQTFILIHNDLQKKYNKQIHFMLTLSQESKSRYLFTFCSETLPNYSTDYEEDELRRLNTGGFSTCFNAVNQSTWLSLSAIIE